MKPAYARRRFYREVLGTVELEEVKTDLSTAREYRARLGNTVRASDQGIRPFARRIGRLREFTPAALVSAINDSLAADIVSEFLWRRDVQVVTPETAANYTKKSENLQRLYREALRLEHHGDLSPVVAVQHLFEQAKSLAPDSWNQYRSALLFTFRQTRDYLIRQLKDHAAFDRAIAILAIVDRAPHANEKIANEVADRKKGVRVVDSDAVFRQLAVSPVNRSRTTLIFAQATLATGVRPGEWGDAEYIAADESDSAGHPVLRVRTGKRKAGAEDVFRDVKLNTPELQTLVQEQLSNVQWEICNAAPDAKTSPLANLIKKCSALIMEICRTLRPNNPKRWFTLYSLRHQAIANLKSEIGADIAAATMGHSVVVSRRNYSPKSRASKGLKAAISPGPEILKRVQAARAAKALKDAGQKPWQKQKPIDPEDGPEVGVERPGG